MTRFRALAAIFLAAILSGRALALPPQVTLPAGSSTSVTTMGGTTSRTLADHLKQIVSVMDYGAKCDGVTRDTDAFNAAIAGNAGGMLTGPANATCIIDPIAIAVPITIQLPHTAHIKLKTGTWTSTALVALNADGITIDGGWWDFNNAAQAGSNSAVIYSGLHNNTTIKNAKITGGQTYGITITDSNDLTISGNTVSGAGQNAIQITAATINVLRTNVTGNAVDLSSIGGPGKGIALTNTSGGAFQFSGPAIRNNNVTIASNTSTLGIEVWAASSPVNFNVTLINNTVTGGAFGISCNGCVASTMSTNTLFKQTGFGLEYASTLNSTISGNSINGNGALITGIAIDNGTSTGNTVTANAVTGLAAASSVGIYTDSAHTNITANTVSSGATGIEVNTADAATITGNNVNNTSGSNIGIWVIESSSSIVANNVVAWGGNGISLLANAGPTRDNLQIANNISTSVNANPVTNTGAHFGPNVILQFTGSTALCVNLTTFNCYFTGNLDPTATLNNSAPGAYLKQGFSPGGQFWIQEATGAAGWYPALVRRSGATAARPAIFSGYIGVPYFDTTLGYPVWWNGAHWVDGAGVTR